MVKPIKKILVPFDNSPNSKRALTHAITIAKLSGGTITLIHVISYHSAIAKIIQPYQGKIISHVKKFMKDAKHAAFKEGIISNGKISYGNPSQEIMAFLKTKNFDLIIMGRRGTTKITGPSLGSVSNAIIQSSKIPVLVVS